MNLSKIDRGMLEQLAGLIDESDYDTQQWVEALFALWTWLEDRSMELSLDDQFGYVSCAVESIGAGASYQNLSSLVEEMLATYGCDRAVKKNSD